MTEVIQVNEANEIRRETRPTDGSSAVLPARRPSGRGRTCVGCGVKEEDATALVRLVIDVAPEGAEPSGSAASREAPVAIAVDAAGGSFGRGAHVHPRPSCLEGAAKRGLARSFKRAIHTSAAELAAAITDAMDRRVGGLLQAAVRSRRAVIGADAVIDACRRGDAELVVVAVDAAAAADLGEVRRKVADGRAVAWGTKAMLAEACPGSSRRHEGLAVVAITSTTIAAALKQAVQTGDAVRGQSRSFSAGLGRGA